VKLDLNLRADPPHYGGWTAESHPHLEALRERILSHAGSMGHGAKSDLARRSGISQPHLSRFIARKSGFGLQSIARVQRALDERQVVVRRSEPAQTGELDVMHALESLPDDARQRVLQWAMSRWT
jgi:predicted transcriptional regulator